MKSPSERIATARKIARKLSRKYNLSPPVDVYSLAMAENLYIVYKENQFGIDASVKLNEDWPVITLNPEQTYEPRIRFTLAHEIGHVKIPWHTGVTSCSTDNPYVYIQTKKQVDSQELEANAFASELLIPTDWLRQKANTSGSFQELLDEVTKETGASVMACLYALENVLSPGHIVFVTTPTMSYWKSFCAKDTYTWKESYKNDFSFLDSTCIINEAFERGSYTVRHYYMLPCPEVAEIRQIYNTCDKNLTELLDVISDYRPELLLHCLDRILCSLPDQFSLAVESYTKKTIIKYHTPDCYIRFPEYIDDYDDIADWVIESGESYGEVSLAEGRRLLWLKQRKYQVADTSRVDSKELLKKLIRKHCTPFDADDVFLHINGVIGSANTRNTKSEEELFQLLKARFSQDEQVRAMIPDPDFDKFLYNRIKEIISRRRKK